MVGRGKRATAATGWHDRGGGREPKGPTELMTSGLSGAPQRRRVSLRWLVALAVAVLALAFAGEALAAKKKIVVKHPTAKTDAVPAVPPAPVPHPSPKRDDAAPETAVAAPVPATSDAIGALISGNDDTSEASSTEDSDAPEAIAPRPDFSVPRPLPPPVGGAPVNPVGLKLALQFIDNNNPAGALLAAYALPNRADIKLVDWLVATGGYVGVPSGTLVDREV